MLVTMFVMEVIMFMVVVVIVVAVRVPGGCGLKCRPRRPARRPPGPAAPGPHPPQGRQDPRWCRPPPAQVLGIA